MSRSPAGPGWRLFTVAGSEGGKLFDAAIG
jgi:hypothetical protein